MKKVVVFNKLSQLINQLKPSPIVLVGGCFDILHLGHVRFLKEAKKYGTVVVALESDKTLTTHKGHLRPIHTQNERAEVLANLESVDYILLLPHFTSHQKYYDLTKQMKPQVIALTEGDPLIAKKQEQAKLVGAKVIIVPKIETPSTTQLAKLLGLE